MKLNKKDVAIIIFLAIFTAVASTLIIAKNASGAWSSEMPILERYYNSGNYDYMINPITDVVYIKTNVRNMIGLEIIDSYSLVPLYKPDGTLMTGEELKQIYDDNQDVIVY